MALLMNLALAIGLFSGMVVLQIIGRRIGRSAQPSPGIRAGAGLLDAAIFALLGLLLAFQFSRAASRLDVRRNLVVEEANAIGTAYLRLDLLSPARQAELREMFRTYTDARIRFADGSRDKGSAESADAEARRLQADIWNLAVDAVRQESSSAPAILLLASLNEMIDATASRNVASHTHVPTLIVLLLLSSALFCALLAGYAMASESRPDWLHMIVFAAVVAGTVFVVFDLEYPRRGLIRIGAADRALVEVRRSMDR